MAGIGVIIFCAGADSSCAYVCRMRDLHPREFFTQILILQYLQIDISLV